MHISKGRQQNPASRAPLRDGYVKVGQGNISDAAEEISWLQHRPMRVGEWRIRLARCAVLDPTTHWQESSRWINYAVVRIRGIPGVGTGLAKLVDSSD